MRDQTPFAYAPPPLAALPGEARILLKAARLWVLLARSSRAPLGPLSALLGPAAARFSVLMDELSAAWPDPFTTFPPCAASLSPDEQVLLSVLARAEAGAEQGFHADLADLLGPDARRRLWQAACRVMDDRIGAG
jgi:hypothetical protein